jgi:hypothetical protein
MRGILPTFADTKYNIIRSEERRLAKAVAKKIAKMPEITVWAFMIPFIFVFSFLKYKRTSETFALNFLFTKRLALDAALDIIKKGLQRQDVIVRINDKTRDVLASDTQGVYSEKIRMKQMNEINLLLDHYLKLLEAEGKNYKSLLKNAYQTQDNYRTFLQQLTAAEKAVNQAALQTVGKSETAHEIISEMENATESIRTEEAKIIFS